MSPSLLSLGHLSPLDEIANVIENMLDLDRVLQLHRLSPNSCSGGRLILQDQEIQERRVNIGITWNNVLQQSLNIRFDPPAALQGFGRQLILQIIEPIWHSKTETATRVRMRIEAVLDWATAKKYRTGDNPARWHGLIGELLPAPSKVKRSKPFPSLPYSELPGFMERLRGIEAVGARALEYLILTIARTSQVTDMPWLEYDPEGAIWNVPFDRMKGGRAHRVPLTTDAVAVLDKVAKLRVGDVVFPGKKHGRPISTATMAKLLKDMGLATGTATVHGFRATFKTWATDRGYAWEAAEMAMSHAVGNKVERAYLRSDLLETRRQLAEDWAAFCRSGRMAVTTPPVPAAQGAV